MPRVIVTIQKDGQVKMKVENLPGKDCLAATKTLEENLGTVTSRELTSEFYSQPQDNVTIRKEVKSQ